MKTREDIEGFLDRVAADGATVSEVESGLWVVKPGGELDFDVVVHCSADVVLLRVKVMDVPQDEGEQLALFRRLLEFNAEDLVHGAYGLDAGAVVLNDTLSLGHLDYEEFLSSYESITLALASHLRELGSHREAR
ncbi:MAG TPA: YbjN domain-containing protein [Gemmatimonadaceae bacterium]|nr:YbjN domain-containing protein [Gemmatimonadaceae bacterium]